MLVIWWEGKGWLVPAIIFGCSLAGNLLAILWTGSGEYWDQSEQPFAVSFFVAGVICWFLGSRLEKEPTVVLLDGSIGEYSKTQPKPTFFALPMKWWGVIAMVGSILIFVIQMT